MVDDGDGENIRADVGEGVGANEATTTTTTKPVEPQSPITPTPTLSIEQHSQLQLQPPVVEQNTLAAAHDHVFDNANEQPSEIKPTQA
jgi:hypothetical protein